MPAGDAPQEEPPKLSRLQVRVWFLSAMGIFLDGFDLFILGVALPLIARDLGIGPYQQGLLGAAAVLGAVVGAVTMGNLADRLGRRLLLRLDLLAFGAFTLLSAFSWDFTSLFIARLLLGVAIGADYPIAAATVAEFLPKRMRDRPIVAMFSFQALGMMSGAALGILILELDPAPDAWRWMLAAGVVPAAVVALLRIGIPETPRWAKSRAKAASARAPSVPVSALFRRGIIARTTLAAVPWFAMDVMLYGIGFFTPTVLAALEGRGSRGTPGPQGSGPPGGPQDGDFASRDIASTIGTAELDILLVAGFVIAILLIGRVDATKLQIAGFGVCAFALGIVTWAAAVSPGGNAPDIAYVVIGFALFNLAVNAGPNPTTYLIAARVFPTELRATGHGLATAAGKSGAAMGIFLLPVLKDGVSLAAAMGVSAAAGVLGLVTTIVLARHGGDAELAGPARSEVAPAEGSAAPAVPVGDPSG
jgi:MFS family permease